MAHVKFSHFRGAYSAPHVFKLGDAVAKTNGYLTLIERERRCVHAEPTMEWAAYLRAALEAKPRAAVSVELPDLKLFCGAPDIPHFAPKPRHGRLRGLGFDRRALAYGLAQIDERRGAQVRAFALRLRSWPGTRSLVVVGPNDAWRIVLVQLVAARADAPDLAEVA